MFYRNPDPNRSNLLLSISPRLINPELNLSNLCRLINPELSRSKFRFISPEFSLSNRRLIKPDPNLSKLFLKILDPTRSKVPRLSYPDPRYPTSGTSRFINPEFNRSKYLLFNSVSSSSSSVNVSSPYTFVTSSSSARLMKPWERRSSRRFLMNPIPRRSKLLLSPTSGSPLRSAMAWAR